MASVGAEHEQAINEWIKAFEGLPADRQENLKRWFATQKIIIENSGLKVEEWFRHVQWAMDNPFDYAFILEFPDSPDGKAAKVDAKTKDAAERSDKTRNARELIGSQKALNAPEEGKGITDKAKSERSVERELFDRFMKERLGGGGGRK